MAFCYFATPKGSAEKGAPPRSPPLIMQSSVLVCMCVLMSHQRGYPGISRHYLARFLYRFLSLKVTVAGHKAGKRKLSAKGEWEMRKWESGGAGKLSEAKSTLKLSVHFGVKWWRGHKKPAGASCLKKPS